MTEENPSEISVPYFEKVISSLYNCIEKLPTTPIGSRSFNVPTNAITRVMATTRVSTVEEMKTYQQYREEIQSNINHLGTRIQLMEEIKKKYEEAIKLTEEVQQIQKGLLKTQENVDNASDITYQLLNEQFIESSGLATTLQNRAQFKEITKEDEERLNNSKSELSRLYEEAFLAENHDADANSKKKRKLKHKVEKFLGIKDVVNKEGTRVKKQKTTIGEGRKTKKNVKQRVL